MDRRDGWKLNQRPMIFATPKAMTYFDLFAFSNKF
jgi:hypothetical protein